MIVRAQDAFSLKTRLFVFISLWVFAALICAIFAEGTVEAGDSAFRERLGIFYSMPLIAGIALPYDLGLQRHVVLACCVIVLIFVVHAGLALGSTSRRAFLVMSAVQVGLLLISVVSVLYFYHYEATHGHG
jgi:hypothetical protein